MDMNNNRTIVMTSHVEISKGRKYQAMDGSFISSRTYSRVLKVQMRVAFSGPLQLIHCWEFSPPKSHYFHVEALKRSVFGIPNCHWLRTSHIPSAPFCSSDWPNSLELSCVAQQWISACKSGSGDLMTVTCTSHNFSPWLCGWLVDWLIHI